MDPRDPIDTWNRLLGGELSAVDSYRQALERFRGEAVAPIFTEFESDHLDCAQWWREWVRSGGGAPVEQPGRGNLFARRIEAHDRLFGENSILEVLLKGEERGWIAYEELLADGAEHASLVEVVRTIILPRQRRHVTTLRELTATR